MLERSAGDVHELSDKVAHLEIPTSAPGGAFFSHKGVRTAGQAGSPMATVCGSSPRLRLCRYGKQSRRIGCIVTRQPPDR